MAPRACDRCHSIRARCSFEAGKSACDRCLRLNHSCRTRREVLRAGRPRKVDATRQLELSAEQLANVLGDLDPSEVRLAHYFLQNQNRLYGTIGEADFNITNESTLIRLLLSAPHQIKDALLALAAALITDEDAEDGAGAWLNAEDALASMNRCCKAIEMLRQTDSRTIDDAKATVFVATSLFSFNDLTIGYGILPIARAALLSVQPFYEDLLSREFDQNLISLIFGEMGECIKGRELPGRRFELPPTKIVDRSYGLAHELLPYLYDFCELNNDMKLGNVDTESARLRAQDLMDEVEAWEPDIGVENEAQVRLSKSQRLKTIQHAQCYKLMTILLLEQFQSHHRQVDMECAKTADLIRQKAKRLSTSKDASIQFVMLPYFVACTEARKGEEQANALAEMKHLSGGVASQCCNRMYEFLQEVWTARENEEGIYWFDLVDDGTLMSIGP